MEFVKHHVVDSGSTTLKEFFHSSNVDFDAPSKSLRANITKAKCKFIFGLSSGFTSAADEQRITDTIATSEDSSELVRLLMVMVDWDNLDSELEYFQVDAVSKQVAQVVDQANYVVYQLIRRYLALLDYTTSPTLGDCLLRLLEWPYQFQTAEFDSLLKPENHEALLRTVTSAAMRKRLDMVEAADVPDHVIKAYVSAGPHRVDEVISLMHQVRYTTTICDSLAVLNYYPLYSILTDVVSPNLPDGDRQRRACFETFERMNDEFEAAAKSVELVGDDDAKSTVKRFMAAYRAAIDNYPVTLPAPAYVSAIMAAIGAVGNDLNSLKVAIVNLPEALFGQLTLADILGTNGDDNARMLVSYLNSQSLLEKTSIEVKSALIKAMLSGSTGDDDEIGILNVLGAARTHDKAELYQLVTDATWSMLYGSFDGDEYDSLLALLDKRPLIEPPTF